MIKTLKLGMEFPQSVKRHLQKPTANIITDGERLNYLPQEQDGDSHSYHFYSMLY